MIDLRSWLRVALIDLKFDFRKFAVLLVCLALGVATIAAVGSIGASLGDAIGRNARSLLGGDLEASIGYREATPQELSLFSSLGKVTEVIEITSRATIGDKSALISVRAVDAAYPLVGAVDVAPASGGPQSLASLLAPENGVFGAVADPLLFDRLGVKPGATVRIGNQNFALRGTLEALPDQAARGFAISATVLVSTASLPSTGVLQPGVLARYRYKIDLGDHSYDEAAAAIRKQFGDVGWQVRSPREVTANLTRYLDIFDRFLVLVGLSSLLVGGIGVSNAASAYVGDRERSIATFRSLGATSARMIVHFLVQIMLLGAVGTVIGLLLGAGSTLAVLPVLGGYLSIDLPPALHPAPLVVAAAFGMLIAFVFAYLPLLRAARLRPATLFRAAGGLAAAPLGVRALLRPGTGGMLVIGLAAILGLALLVAHDWQLVLWYLGGAAGAFLLLRLAAWLIQLVVRRLPALPSLAVRMAFRNIYRPGAPTPAVMLSLGLGLALMLGLALVEQSVRGQLNGQLSMHAPSFVLINVDKPTVSALQDFAKTDRGVATLDFTPSLRGIITKLNGKPVADLTGLDPSAVRLLGGDQPLSWRDDLPPGDKLLEGKWWAPGYKGPPLLSLDDDFARPLHLKVGDSMEISISGRPITATIANIRRVDWQNASLSFDILFSPGLIEAAPATYLGSLKAKPGDERLIEASLVKSFPTLGFIPVGDVLAQISTVVGSLANAVAIVGGVAIVSGMFVLAGALAAGRKQREADAVVAKVLGATRWEIAAAYLAEYGLLGLLATLVAAGLGSLGAWAIVTRVLELEFSFDPALLVEVAFGAMLATILTGLATTWSALSSRPAAFLRAEE
ncbi:MAG TPA: FtsX-like permease family protein [Devosiaceae bacterium]|nr:FtsX-like permease family protein [Devosiaceae bacterium]